MRSAQRLGRRTVSSGHFYLTKSLTLLSLSFPEGRVSLGHAELTSDLSRSARPVFALGL